MKNMAQLPLLGKTLSKPKNLTKENLVKEKHTGCIVLIQPD